MIKKILGGKKKGKFVNILIIIVLIIISLWSLSSAFKLLLKIDYLLGSSLAVFINPPSQSLNLHYGESSTTSFNVTTRSPFYCKTNCTYDFYDTSKGILRDSGNFLIKSNQFYYREYNISIDKLGVGQDIYNFQIRCRNIKTFVCVSPKEDYKSASSFVSVNYNLTEALTNLKESLRENLAMHLQELSAADIYMQNLNRNIFELGSKANLRGMENDKERLNIKLDSMIIDAEKFNLLWASQNYINLSEAFNYSTFSGSLSLALREAKSLNESLAKTLERHNIIINNINSIGNEIKLISTSASLPELSSNEEFLISLNISIEDFNSIISLVSNNSFENYGGLAKKVSVLDDNLTYIENKSINITALNFVKGQFLMMQESDALCLFRNNCMDNISISHLFNDSEKLFNIGSLKSSSKISDTCSMLQSLRESLIHIKNKTIEQINKSGINLPDSQEFVNYAERRKSDVLSKRDESYANSFNMLKEKNTTKNSSPIIANSFEIVMNQLPKRLQKPIEINPNFEENSTSYILSRLNFSDKTEDYIKNVCRNLNAMPPLANSSDLILESLQQENYTAIPRIKSKLEDDLPTCCVFGRCGPCCNTESCANDPKTFPIIFVHGHSVRKSNSPDFSLDTFDKIQIRLQEDGYLNAGILLYSGGDKVKKGEWGLSGKPVTVKTSYYFDIYRKEDNYILVPAKSESIDTYALRLNDIINVVKERTGKPKVNLIAFSMGGLVTRKYLQIYGDGSVSKLITIGSPHKGIIGNVAGVCPVLGENKECQDMQENSLFLNKLNDPSRQPKNIEVYAIIGTGCDMDGKDGDGIVLADHSSLSGIINAKEYYVKGNCDGSFHFLHTDLPKIDKYPEVYDYIVKSLKE